MGGSLRNLVPSYQTRRRWLMAEDLCVFFYIPRQDMFMDQVIEYLVLQGTPVEATAERLHSLCHGFTDEQKCKTTGCSLA